MRFEPVLAQRGAGHRSDADQPRVADRRRPGAVQEVGDRGRRGEGDVVGPAQRGQLRIARRPRGRSHRAPARPPRRRGARRASGSTSRASAARAIRARVTETSASASTRPSATKRSGTTSAITPCAAERRGGSRSDRGDTAPGQGARVEALLRHSARTAAGPRSGWSGRGGRSGSARGAAMSSGIDPDRRRLHHGRAELAQAWPRARWPEPGPGSPRP